VPVNRKNGDTSNVPGPNLPKDNKEIRWAVPDLKKSSGLYIEWKGKVPRGQFLLERGDSRQPKKEKMQLSLT